MSTWRTASPREWTFGENHITGVGGGIGSYGLSYALHWDAGALLNGRISANLRLLRRSGVGAGLVCRADENWNFVGFFVAPSEADSDLTFARLGVCHEGILVNIATSENPVRLGTGYNRFSLEFFSGQVRGQIDTANDVVELSANCVEMPFPGLVGIVRLYGSSLMATKVFVQQTSISLTEDPMFPETAANQYDFDVFLCHSSSDKETVREIAKILTSHGISYWLDEDQIAFGDRVTERIEDGLKRSRYVVPCLSASLGGSNWTRGEYGAILNTEFSGETDRVVIPLVIDESGDESIPLLLRDKRRAFFVNKTEFEHFVQFLLRR